MQCRSVCLNSLRLIVVAPVFGPNDFVVFHAANYMHKSFRDCVVFAVVACRLVREQNVPWGEPMFFGFDDGFSVAILYHTRAIADVRNEHRRLGFDQHGAKAFGMMFVKLLKMCTECSATTTTVVLIGCGRVVTICANISAANATDCSFLKGHDEKETPRRFSSASNSSRVKFQ